MTNTINPITIDLNTLPRAVQDAVNHIVSLYPDAKINMSSIPKEVEKVKVREPALRLRYFRYCLPNGSIALNGGYTVEYMVDNHKVIKYRIAQCSLEDKFNKRIGRAMVAIKPWAECSEPMSYSAFDTACRNSLENFKDQFVARLGKVHLKVIAGMKDKIDYINNTMRVNR